MTISMTTQLHTLHRSTGSAHHVSAMLGQEVLCSVNAPVEVQRRDELPNEAFIDVHIRPNHGVGMIKERHLEDLVQGLVKDVILVRLWPRTAVQITLQILKNSGNEGQEKTDSYLTILPALLNATCLALLDAGVPMRCIFASTILHLDSRGNVDIAPDAKTLASADSLHVFAYSSKGELLLAESEGTAGFSLSQWASLETAAKDICMGLQADTSMAVDGKEDYPGVTVEEIRSVIQDKVIVDNRWRNG